MTSAAWEHFWEEPQLSDYSLAPAALISQSAQLEQGSRSRFSAGHYKVNYSRTIFFLCYLCISAQILSFAHSSQFLRSLRPDFCRFFFLIPSKCQELFLLGVRSKRSPKEIFPLQSYPWTVRCFGYVVLGVRFMDSVVNSCDQFHYLPGKCLFSIWNTMKFILNSTYVHAKMAK